MDGGVITVILTIVGSIVAVLIVGAIVFFQYRKTLREAKNYERGLKMVPLMIHLPPSSEDAEKGGRDEREFTEEIISEAQVMYNIISSTATKGFKSRIYGQRHISFEIVASRGLVHYYAVVPTVLIDTVRQAISAAYPSARLQEMKEHNIFSKTGRSSGVIGGEFTLNKEFQFPIATYEESKRDASRAILDAISRATREDGIAIQIMIRPADPSWVKVSESHIKNIRDEKSGKKSTGFGGTKGLLEALWKPPESKEKDGGPNAYTSTEQSTIDAVEAKTRYPGYETLIRVVVSSNTSTQSQALLRNVVSAFSLFNSSVHNGFKFTITKNIEELVQAYIFRFFPQKITQNILNSVELATIFHLPSQGVIPSSQVQRQLSKQVDGPTQRMEEGFLIGYNDFRGVRKPIRLSTNDRRRHMYMIGQTGTGKSGFLGNLAYQDIMDGRGFAFMDPHGDAVEELLGCIPQSRLEDVIYFNPGDLDSPIGLNMFEFDTEDQKDFIVQECINMLYGLYDPGHTGIVGPRLEHIFRNCALLLMSDPRGGTFIDIPKLLVDEAFMKDKLQYVTDQQVLDFWTKEFPASQRSSESGEVTSWVVSKFGPFISNAMMRNIIGQQKSGFNIADIMNGKKILLVNLSKGKMGELNSRLIGMIFVMKFQAAAFSRAKMEESERQDFCLYIDEFQNYATDSIESILSEARKYRLNLIIANQFMTQLTDKIREAIIGNVGTVVSGRIGITDAELLVKKFQPNFTAEDLAKLPNYQSIATVMIEGSPSAPFSMSLVPPMAKPNKEIFEAMSRLCSAKNGRPRAIVEKEIFTRLAPPETPSVAPMVPRARVASSAGQNQASATSGGSSYLDEWLAKRKKATPPIEKIVQTNTPVSSPPQNTAQDALLAPSRLSLSQAEQHKDTLLPASQHRSYSTSESQEMPLSTFQQAAAPVPAAAAPKKSGVSLRGAVSDTEEVVVKLR